VKQKGPAPTREAAFASEAQLWVASARGIVHEVHLLVIRSQPTSLPSSMKSIVRYCLALLVVVLTAGAADNPAPAKAHRFEKDIAAFEAADKKSPPPKGAILFVGDSTFTRWKTIHEDLAEYTLINRGFGGSQMDDLLYFTDRIVVPYQPRLIVVQEGGNDLHSGRAPEQVVGDLKAFVEKVQRELPGVPMVIGSLAPSPARWVEIEKRKQLDALMKEYVATLKNVQFVYFFDAFLGPDGLPREDLFVEDRTHPSALGYQLREKIIRPLLGAPDRTASPQKP
jgi:lysophospholipase L1-like esterase